MITPFVKNRKPKDIIYQENGDEITIQFSEDMTPHEFLESTAHLMKTAVWHYAQSELVSPLESWKLVEDFIREEKKKTSWKWEDSDKDGFDSVLRHIPNDNKE